VPQLFYLPGYQALSSSGTPLGGAKLYFYLTGTSTAASVYADAALTTALANPVIADSQGRFPQVYPLPTVIYRVVLTDSTGVQQWLQDGTSEQLFPRTAAEIAASVTVVNYAYEPGNVLRYGLVPNDTTQASSNTSILLTLLSPSVAAGPEGPVYFPNSTGTDTYYLNGIIQIRPGVRLDLGGSVLSFSKTYATSDDCFGFLTFIRDVSVENGAVSVNYSGSGGNNPGPIMRIGGRSGGAAPTYNFGSITPANFYEVNFTTPMGNVALRNLRLSTNNAAAPAVHMLGGLENVSVENVYIDGGGAAAFGIYYEFGYWSQNGQPATPSLWTSSHAMNLNFSNLITTNMVPAGSGSDGGGLGLTGCYNCVVDGLFVDTAYNGFEFRPGEALFYRLSPRNATGAKRSITLRNIVCQNITSTGIQLTGAESASGGYLATLIAGLGHPADYVAQTDLMNFSLDGFAINAGGEGLNVSGSCDIRNGTLSGTSNSGQLVITDECTRFSFTNVLVLNSSYIGVRANFGGAIWVPARRKTGTLDDCLIAGNTGPGISIANCKCVKVRACRLGYNALYDLTSEATQTSGISVDATTSGGGVNAEGCFATTSGGALAYSITGSTTQLLDCCNIAQPKGTVTFTAGLWDIDGVAQVSQATIGPNAGSKSTYINNLGGLSAVAITFTAAPTGAGATLNANWAGAGGLWPITFSDAEVRYGSFVNGQSAVTWTPILSGSPTASATVNTCGSNKYAGKMAFDTTNRRLLIATGPQCTDSWERADGGASVTPS
jgi:hypothetical protein